MLLPGAAEQQRGHGHLVVPFDGLVGVGELLPHDARPVGGRDPESTGIHLLEAQGQGDVAHAVRHRLARQEEGRRTRRAGVVDVDDRDAREPHFVQRLLAAGGVAVVKAGVGLLDLAVFQPRILQGQARGFGAHGVVRFASAWLLEGHHAYARHPGCSTCLRHLHSPTS